MPLNTHDIDFLRSSIADRSGHVISSEQGYLLESRLLPLAKSEGLTSVEALVAAARNDRPSLVDSIAEAMTINETFFFRDAHPFQALREEVLPQLIEARKDRKELSIWSAACSSGQEAYSIGITIRDAYPELNHWKVRIIGTDICDKVIAHARNASYSQFEVNRGLPAAMLVRYFDREGMNWRVKPTVREMVEFRKLNLTHRWVLFPKFDIVFLRNVLIYFSNPTKEAILRQVRKHISDDGHLFLGGGETLLSLNTDFQRHSVQGSVCYRPQQ